MNKRLLPFAAAVAALLTAGAHASTVPVIDAAHMASNKISQTIDYVQQLVHEANQQTQITHQVEQIAQLYEQIEQLYTQIGQMDDYLDRFGVPGEITDLAGAVSLADSLGAATGGLEIEALVPELTGEGMFRADGGGVFDAIGDVFAVGKTEHARDPSRYLENDAVRATVEQYREKKADVLERRDALRREVAATAEQLRAAETDSEVKKLSAVLAGLQTELGATDRELDVARGDLEAREAEHRNQAEAKAAADAEAEARRTAEGNRLDVETYLLDRSRYGW